METWQDPKTFALGLGLILLIIIVLSLFVIILSRLYTRRLLREQAEKNRMKLEHQRSLTNALVDMQEKERARIAADLHDDLVSKLRTVHLMMITGKAVPGKDPVEMLAESIELSREISHDLMPPMLEHSQFNELLEEALFILKSGHDVEYTVLGDSAITAAPDIKLQFFRIVKEVINNVDKHARADKVSILIRSTLRGIAVCIRDNGIGIPDAREMTGLGMKSIELRVQRIEALYKFKNHKSGGSTFLFYLPLKLLKEHE